MLIGLLQDRQSPVRCIHYGVWGVPHGDRLCVDLRGQGSPTRAGVVIAYAKSRSAPGDRLSAFPRAQVGGKEDGGP